MSNQMDQLLAAEQTGLDQLYKTMLGRELRQNRPITASWGDAVANIGRDIADDMRLERIQKERLAVAAERAGKIRQALEIHAPEYIPLFEAGDIQGAQKGLAEKIAQAGELEAYNRTFGRGRTGGGAAPAGPERLGSAENYPAADQGEFQVFTQTGGGGQRKTIPYEEVAFHLGSKNPRVAKAADDYIKRVYPDKVDPNQMYYDPETEVYGRKPGAAEVTEDIERTKARAGAGMRVELAPTRDPQTGKVQDRYMTAEQRAAEAERLYGRPGGAPAGQPAVLRETLGDTPAPAPRAAPERSGELLTPPDREKVRMDNDLLGSLFGSDPEATAMISKTLRDRGVPQEVIDMAAKGQEVRWTGGMPAAPAQRGGQVLTQAIPARTPPAAGPGIPAGAREAQVIGEQKEAERLAAEREADMTILKNAPGRLKNLAAIEKNAVAAPYGIQAEAGEIMERFNIPSIAGGKYMPEGYTQYRELLNQTGELLTEVLASKLYGKDLSKQELEDAKKKIVDPATSPESRLAVARQIRQRIEDAVAAAAKRQGVENPIKPGAGAASVPGPRSSAEEARGLPESYWTATAGGAVSDAMPEMRPGEVQVGAPKFYTPPASATEATQPPIKITTGPRDPSLDPDYEARQLREANSPKHLITGFQDAGSNALIGLTQMLPASANSVLARTMSLLPGVNITPEDIELGAKGSSWKAEKERQREESKDKTFYDLGQLIRDVGGGAVIPGGATLKGVTGAALASGALQPATSSFDRMTNMATSALFGNLFRAAAKAEPPRFQGEDAAWKQSRADYFGITPTKEQAAPSSLGAAFQRAEDLSNPAYLDQARAITTKAKVVAGMDPREPLSNVSIDRHLRDLGREYENMFTRTRMAPLASEDARRLERAVQDFPITENMINAGAARNIQRLQNYIANVDPNRIDFVDMRLLHEAWKEVNKVTSEFGASKQAAKALKEQIAGIMERGIGPNGVRDFRRLNDKYATTLDIETMFSKGEGSGSGIMAGVLLPSKILAVTPKIGTSRLGEEIVETISKLPVKDFKPLEVGISSPVQSVRALGRATVDALGRKDIPYTGANAEIIRMLRREAPMFGREFSENIFNQ